MEDINGLQEFLMGNMPPAGNRRLHVEALSKTWNFSQWFGQLGCHVSGLTATHLEPYANHVWRFQSREEFDQEEVECHRLDWQSFCHPKDVVLLLDAVHVKR